LAAELGGSTRFVLSLALFALIGGITAVVVVVAQPALVDATAVAALELVVAAARFRTGAVVQRGVLVGAVHAVRVAVAHPLLGNALRAVPVLVLGARVLHLGVALAVVALVPVVLVRVVQTIIVTCQQQEFSAFKNWSLLQAFKMDQTIRSRNFNWYFQILIDYHFNL
jgi:hypothetical protein